MQNKVIEIRLSEYTPIKDRICKISGDHDQVYAIKFHGNPPKIKLLKYSKSEKKNENIKIEEKFFFRLKKEQKNAISP